TLPRLNITGTRPGKVCYHYDGLKTGLFCYKDGAVFESHSRVSPTRPRRGSQKSVKDAVLQSSRDVHTLYRRETLTIPALYDLSGGLLSKYNLRKALSETCDRHSQARGTYYTFPKR